MEHSNIASFVAGWEVGCCERPKSGPWVKSLKALNDFCPHEQLK